MDHSVPMRRRACLPEVREHRHVGRHHASKPAVPVSDTGVPPVLLSEDRYGHGAEQPRISAKDRKQGQDYPMSDLIPDTPENIMKAILATSPDRLEPAEGRED